MSTAQEPIQVGRARRRCKFCRELDHDLRKCEKWFAKRRAEGWDDALASAGPAEVMINGQSAEVVDHGNGEYSAALPAPPYDVAGAEVRPFETPPLERSPAGPDELVDAAAAAREEIDALDVETAQYQRVRDELDARIAKNRERLIVARAELALLRGARRKRDS